MLRIEIENRTIIPVRLISFVTGWKLSPDVVASILADSNEIRRMFIPSHFLDPDGAYHPMLPKEWDTVYTDLDVLSKTLRATEIVEHENYPIWRDEPDKTKKMLALDEAEYDAAFHGFTAVLPELEEELAELKGIQPESMEARQEKRSEIERIEQQITAIYGHSEAGVKNGTDELEIGSPEWRSQNARNAANARHDQAGGSRDKHQQIRDIWATGNYASRDRCAEDECAALDMSFSAARKALRNTPDP